MELLTEKEIFSIVKQCGFSKVLDWSMKEFPDKLLGHLGDHLNLTIKVESGGFETKLKFFVKCMPRFDILKAKYIKELDFFMKEYVMISSLFEEFCKYDEMQKWRPKALLIKQEVFVLEDVTEIGYQIPLQQNTLTLEELTATVETLAVFHAQSYIHEENKSKALGRPYRIWEDYGSYLKDPITGLGWRDTGRNAVIDYLKVYSKYKTYPNFIEKLNKIVPSLYLQAINLMKPSHKYRNAVIHRDLWANNIFLKREENMKLNALFVDYQTVLYASPMLDLSSLIYFNTTKSDRCNFTKELINCYLNKLSEKLLSKEININDIFDVSNVFEAYTESLVFGITQASLIVPIITMSKDYTEKIFGESETNLKALVESRSQYFIDMAKDNEVYRNRLTELFDELVELYIFPDEVK